ncbi:MAG: hypothetical protein A4E48_00938 [Methanosaeta sp. PtaU1.Bin060]|jgi:ABC-type dipeptide/oligopeptide/nickel transport system permease component|nr:MAG: hypothetical protein A4E48_00938 [Methanosaeta sp. PtaU1.Bin060]
MSYDAVLAGNYPLLHVGVLVIAVCVPAVNFLANMLYAIPDPGYEEVMGCNRFEGCIF